VLRKVRLN